MSDGLARKKPSNPALDFFLGIFGLLGLVVQVFRNGDTNINWFAFVGGFVASFFLFFLACGACVAALGFMGAGV